MNKENQYFKSKSNFETDNEADNADDIMREQAK